MRPPAPPAPEIPSRTIVKVALGVVLLLVAVALLASQLQTGQTSSASRRTSAGEGILQNAGHVIKRTKGHKIERY